MTARRSDPEDRCPACGVLPADPCLTPKGALLGRDHAARAGARRDRVVEYRTVDDESEVQW